MSDPEKPQQPSNDAAPEAKTTAPQPAAAAKEAAPAAPAAQPAAAKAAPEPPPPPEPGEVGKKLDAAKISVEHLGNDAGGTEMVRATVETVLSVARFLKEQAKFDLLLSVSGVDWKDRLESVYHFYSTETHESFVLKVNAVDERSPSLMSLYAAADWHEREAYDLFGIQYEGHPNLTRILMPNDWIGHPMRKDYKVTDPRLVWNER